MKKIIKRLFLIFLILPCMVIFSACSNDGLSAYEIAVQNGFVGTEAEWLESLKGEDGKDGKNGINGEDGKDAEAKFSAFEIWKDDFDNGRTSLSYADWLKENLNIEIDAEKYAVNKNILSVARVTVFNSLKNAKFNNNPIRAGSAVYYKKDETGDIYFVTNYHVTYASGTSEYGYYRLEFYGTDSSHYLIGEFVGGSATYDLAIIKVLSEELQEKPWFEEMNSKPVLVKTEINEAGTPVVAIGNTNGKGINISTGVIDKDFENVQFDVGGKTLYHRVIKYDAYITNGNSGGGLFDYHGNFIGITNGGESNNDRINYAFPSKVVKTVADELIENHKENPENQSIDTCNLGLSYFVFSTLPTLNNETGLVEVKDKFYIREVSETSPLFENLKNEDIVLKVFVNNSEIDISRVFMIEELMLELEEGDVIKFEVERTGEAQNISVELELIESMFDVVY